MSLMRTWIETAIGTLGASKRKLDEYGYSDAIAAAEGLPVVGIPATVAGVIGEQFDDRDDLVDEDGYIDDYDDDYEEEE